MDSSPSSSPIDSRYDPHALEADIYAQWEQSGYFNPDNLPPRHKKPYSIVLPPPNVTGTLHMGHAVMLVIQDILIRYHRMRGYKTLWLPGTDHAAIATQEKVEKELYKKEGKTRHDLGREAFLSHVDAFAKNSRDTITSQVRKMGSSIDWSREAFTLDETRYLAVRTAFKRMYDAGLIYRGERIVNWDPKMQTTVSDDEIEWEEEKVPFYYFKFGPFVIGTARPETKFGDKYVVMHPQDARYKKYPHGQKISLPWINGMVTATVIKDKAIDPKFGSGVMTITPWHDATDFDIANRHHLDREQIIDYRGILLPIAGEFSGMHISKIRTLLVEKLKDMGLLVKVEENYIHRVAKNSRGGGRIEPQIMKQWFIDVNKEFVMPRSHIKGIHAHSSTTLKEILQSVVKSRQVEILPKRFEKIYFHWINNLRDWCISRQIWYGHRIPVWYRGDEVFCDIHPPEGAGWHQDPDTLDTWFSSGLWTFSTLGWPSSTKDLKLYHPTTVLETGYDILFFWVARMILMSGFLVNDVPFRTVYLHGLVRDAQGRKMSKSLGNIIDPVSMIERYGADATRMSLVVGAAPGNDTRLSEDKIKGYRNFATKIWNAARFVLMHYSETPSAPSLTKSDQQHLRGLEALKKKVAAYIEKYDFHHAGHTLYHYFWHTFADKIIEEAKLRLQSTDAKERARAAYILITILTECLKMLHPFMPFITEALWKKIPSKKGRCLLLIESWKA